MGVCTVLLNSVLANARLGMLLDDFEVSVYLTETSIRHSILRKEKRAKMEKPSLGTTNKRMTGIGTREEPIDVGGGGAPVFVHEEAHEEKDLRLEDIPQAEEAVLGGSPSRGRDASDEGLFLSDGSEDGGSQSQERPSRKGKEKQGSKEQANAHDDKKKMALNTMYDGFSIHGRILCLVVTRKGPTKGKEWGGGAGQAMMEDWIASTQMAEGQMMDE